MSAGRWWPRNSLHCCRPSPQWAEPFCLTDMGERSDERIRELYCSVQFTAHLPCCRWEEADRPGLKVRHRHLKKADSRTGQCKATGAPGVMSIALYISLPRPSFTWPGWKGDKSLESSAATLVLG